MKRFITGFSLAVAPAFLGLMLTGCQQTPPTTVVAPSSNPQPTTTERTTTSSSETKQVTPPAINPDGKIGRAHV